MVDANSSRAAAGSPPTLTAAVTALAQMCLSPASLALASKAEYFERRLNDVETRLTDLTQQEALTSDSRSAVTRLRKDYIQHAGVLRLHVGHEYASEFAGLEAWGRVWATMDELVTRLQDLVHELPQSAQACSVDPRRRITSYVLPNGARDTLAG